MSEIKISELSIGDWVRYESTVRTVPMKVLEIGEKYTMCDGQIYITGETEGGRMFCEITELKPIPLTPEILEKNGFFKWQGGLLLVGEEVSCRYEDGDLTILRGYRDNDGVLIERMLVNIECWNVHQLQHALRLAGVGKEIEV